AFFEQAKDLFDLMISVAATQADGASLALSYAERERARVLLDRLGAPSLRHEPGPGRAEPGSVTALQRHLPIGMALVEYALLEDRLLVWVVRRGSIQMTSSKNDLKALEILVRRYCSGLQK